MEIRDAHFPGRAPVDAYGDGGFRFAQMSHRGSLLCVPSGIYGWNLADPSEFSLDAFATVFEEQADIEVLLIGTGTDLRPIPAELKERFREAGILADPMATGAAVRTFNVLLSENRAVAAALLAVD
ncbi:Mth938-like domain-containing protein [Roseibium salinum]|uniref:Mth938-like domain-containing protein n=1 Tax=Roseibium salinum TaxID=1604349 RepID=A0ABT3R125_9HYPH|nr:Mth938-like domain-containing protein [Roseibium sp. DSM 29163]MCX2722786.1 Mth938-like domain-containing protein [Roseibium sp. DSM 29163]MDN3719277.1 Mth938-like domain-containing protein [Roseibium salinum]